MKYLLTTLIAIMAFGMQLAVADIGEDISGGGQIIGPDRLKVSFGIYALDKGYGEYEAEVEINFHNVSLNDLDKSKFHSVDVTQMAFYPPRSGETTCNAAMNMTLEGTLNGVPGYTVIFRAGDFGAPGAWEAEAFDTVRVELKDAGGTIYDTNDDDFDAESTCVGTARTKLDRGNIPIEML